jgi:hypothetical protein
LLYSIQPDDPGEGRLVTAPLQIARDLTQVKAALLSSFSSHLDALFVNPPSTGRLAEEAAWWVAVAMGNQCLSALLTLACRAVTDRETAGDSIVQLRLDRDYWLTQKTTFGPVTVPLFAFRRDGKTHAPARREVFPLHPHCRSSELCLEWEARLGSQLPFRQAEDALRFFTHGATDVEDCTIARHLLAVGGLVDRSWTYRTPEDIARILEDRATRDTENHRPLLYMSTDAHALRRYVDETFDAPWKMINGIRMWCIDRRSGQVIHLGGEYTWGDCHEVAARFRSLVADYVPTAEAAPQVVLLTDGMKWIADHVVPEMPEDTVLILDFYHAIQNIAAYATARFGAGTRAAKAWLSKVRTQLFGKRGYTRPKRQTRKGPRKAKTSASKRTIHPSEDRRGAGEHLANQLLSDEVDPGCEDAHDKLLSFTSNNAHRMDYPRYRERGIQVGSGAMESLHRIASQMRLKLAGARWLPETAIAILGLRMMLLAERWDDFWHRAGATSHLVTAFRPQPW